LRLSKVNAQPGIVAPHHLAALGLLAWHDKLKNGRDSNCSLHHKTCTDCREVADCAFHRSTSEKNLTRFEYPSTRTLAAFVHRGIGPSPLHHSLGYLPNRQKKPDARHLAGPLIGLEVSRVESYCNRSVILSESTTPVYYSPMAAFRVAPRTARAVGRTATRRRRWIAAT